MTVLRHVKGRGGGGKIILSPKPHRELSLKTWKFNENDKLPIYLLYTWLVLDDIHLFSSIQNIKLNRFILFHKTSNDLSFNNLFTKKGLKCIGRVGTPTRASYKAHPLMSWDYNEEPINILKIFIEETTMNFFSKLVQMNRSNKLINILKK